MNQEPNFRPAVDDPVEAPPDWPSRVEKPGGLSTQPGAPLAPGCALTNLESVSTRTALWRGVGSPQPGWQATRCENGGSEVFREKENKTTLK